MPKPSQRMTDPETGRDILVYENGCARDAETGAFVRGPNTIDPKTGERKYNTPVTADPSGMVARRYELAKQRQIQDARDALDDASIKAGRLDKSLAGTGYGWYALVEKAGELAFASTSARGAEGLLSFLGRATGNLAEPKEGNDDPGSGIAAQLTAAVIEFARRLHEARGEVVEGEEVSLEAAKAQSFLARVK